MALDHPLLPLSRTAGGAIAPYRFCKASTDGKVLQNDSATGAVQGVNGPNAQTSGEVFTMQCAGIVPIEYGGNVTNGNKLTSNADGKAVVATEGDDVFGRAMEDGDSGTHGSILLGFGQTGPQGEQGEPGE